MMEDKTILISESTKGTECVSRDLLWKLFILSIVGCLNYFSIGMHSYTVNEWTQHQVKVRYFGNISIQSNFSACTETNKSDPDYITYTHVQQETARWQIYNTVASTVPAFITALVYPSYSDTFGRKYLFILSLIGVFLQLFIDCITISLNGNLVFTVLGSFMFGITGTTYCLLSAMFSYIADITENGKQRTAAMTIVESELLIMSTTSGLAVGFYIDAVGYVSPAITAACMSFVNLLIVIFILPETLEQSRRHKRLPVIKSVKRITNFYLSKEFKGKRTLYILMIVSFIVLDLCSVHRRSLEVLYQLGMPFCWGPKKIGYFAALSNVGQSLAAIGLIVVLQKCLSDVSIGMLASLSNACSYILEAFASTDLMLYLVAVPVLLANMTTPMVRGIMSAMTSPDQQGALFASICVIQNLVWLVASFGDNLVYSATVGFMNGFVFLVLAGVAVLGIILLGVFKVLKQKADRIQKEVAVNADQS